MALLNFLRLHCFKDYAHLDSKFLFNYHITHVVNLNDKKTPVKAKFSKLCKMFLILIYDNFFQMSVLLYYGSTVSIGAYKNCQKSWRTWVRPDISSTFCRFELMSGRTNVLDPNYFETWIKNIDSYKENYEMYNSSDGSIR